MRGIIVVLMALVLAGAVGFLWYEHEVTQNKVETLTRIVEKRVPVPVPVPAPCVQGGDANGNPGNPPHPPG